MIKMEMHFTCVFVIYTVLLKGQGLSQIANNLKEDYECCVLCFVWMSLDITMFEWTSLLCKKKKNGQSKMDNWL